MFTDAFCAKLVAEVDSVAASGIPVQRPNSMNNYGVILNLVGMRDMFTWIQREVGRPISHSLGPHSMGTDSPHRCCSQSRRFFSQKQDSSWTLTTLS